MPYKKNEREARAAVRGVQSVRARVLKSDNLSSIPGILVVGEENRLVALVL